jgi:hypothetical protein
VCLALVLTTCAVLMPGVARAQEDAAAAESLFQEARKLSDAGNYKEACPKFLASQKAGPGVGTLLNLGACYEKLGLTASAWARYKEAQSFAQRTNRPDREKTAKERAQKLESRLPRLTITTKESNVDVKRDDTPVDEGALGSPVPVDPGSHTITAKASGKKTWSKTITIAEGQTEAVIVPALEEDSGGGSKPGGTDTGEGGGSGGGSVVLEPKGNTMRTASYVVMGAGVVTVGAGAYFGISTFSTWSDAKKHCTGSVCDPTGVKLAGDAKTSGTISTATTFGGVALVGVGLILFFMSPATQAARAPTGTLMHPTVTPAVGQGFAGLSLSGTL